MKTYVEISIEIELNLQIVSGSVVILILSLPICECGCLSTYVFFNVFQRWFVFSVRKSFVSLVKFIPKYFRVDYFGGGTCCIYHDKKANLQLMFLQSEIFFSWIFFCSDILRHFYPANLLILYVSLWVVMVSFYSSLSFYFLNRLEVNMILFIKF